MTDSHVYITVANKCILCQFNYKITSVKRKAQFRYFNTYALQIHVLQVTDVI
jgi:hypothetical protein